MIKKFDFKFGNVDFKIELINKLTLIGGDSGVGKSLLFQGFQYLAKEREYEGKLICINVLDSNASNIDTLCKTNKNKVFVIDNGDLIIPIETRRYIADDKNNQYIIFARNTKGYTPLASNICALEVSTNNKGILDYYLME